MYVPTFHRLSCCCCLISYNHYALPLKRSILINVHPYLSCNSFSTLSSLQISNASFLWNTFDARKGVCDWSVINSYRLKFICDINMGLYKRAIKVAQLFPAGNDIDKVYLFLPVTLSHACSYDQSIRKLRHKHGVNVRKIARRRRLKSSNAL